ncbi:MAG: YjbQ family protein [Candidatus Omnitrophica bacterium]|nr:YjbQ family protein [Candidatus Omnitrophota bacterium]
MKIIQERFSIKTKGFNDCVDLTDILTQTLHASRIQSGLIHIFIPGSTAGVTTIEYESGAVADLKAAIARMAPENMHYNHDARWGDGNGFSHVRSALIGPSLTVPVADGRPVLGTWQQVILIDCDNRPRNRSCMITVMGI